MRVRSVGRLLGPPQECRDLRQRELRLQRPGQIIVGSPLQGPGDAVVVSRRADHDDGHALRERVTLEGGAYAQPVRVRQVGRQQDESRAQLFPDLFSIASRGGNSSARARNAPGPDWAPIHSARSDSRPSTTRTGNLPDGGPKGAFKCLDA